MPIESASQPANKRHPNSPRDAAGPVIVAGMHRSGTSLVASVLGASGVDIGRELLEPGADNPLGYFEDTEFLYFHDRVLNRRGMSYADLDPRGVPIAFTDSEKEEARALIESRAQRGLWGWKDPRTCLCLPSWSSLLPDARFIVPFRDPMAVLASLVRRGEPRVIGDPLAGLELWSLHVRCTLDFLKSSGAPHIVFDADALMTSPDRVAAAMSGLGLDVSADTIRSLVEPAQYHGTIGSFAFPALLEAACPEACVLRGRLRERATVVCEEGIEPTPGAASCDRAGGALGSDAPRETINALLLAALRAQDPSLGEVLDAFSFRDRLETERKLTRDQQQRILLLEQQKSEIYRELEAQRESGRSNWEQAEQLRSRAEELEARLTQALVAQGEAEEQEIATAAKLDSTASLLGEAQARAARLERERDEAISERTEIEASLDDAFDHLGRSEQMLREVAGERDEAIALMQRYRRRWPPYAAVALLRRAKRSLHHRARRPETALEPENMGREARIAVLHTGMARSADQEASVTESLGAQSLQAQMVVWPGEPDRRVGENTEVRSWWGPDLPSMLAEMDIALITHPEEYGPGPLWHPQQLEMIAAAFASDPLFAAIVFRGGPGEPTTGSFTHLYETDAATIEGWSEGTLAAAFASSAAWDGFAHAISGEARDLIPVLSHLVRTGRKVLIAPRSFPIEAVEADEARAQIGRNLPPRPEITLNDSGPIRSLYVTQWIECGGADKGVLDLVNRSDPDTVRWSLMTTAAAAQSWAPRVAPHVDEMIHLGDHLPLPPDERFPAFLAEYVRRRNIELVHIMHSFQGYDAIPALRRACPGVKIVDQCHILEKPGFAGGGHPVYSTVHYQGLFDHRTVTNHWLKRHLVERFGVPEESVSVIYTGVDWREEFNPRSHDPGKLRRLLGDRLADDGPIIVFLGRLHEQKRPERFARVAALVTEQRPELRANFVMCGHGPLLRDIREQRRRMSDPSRLILAGEVGHSASVLRDANLMLMLSEREGLAYVSFEAMSMGVPQIFTDVNAQSELVTPETGTLIDPDATDLEQRAASEVIRLLDDRAALEAMGEAARSRAVEHFGIEAMVQAYEDLYIRLVGRTPAARARRPGE